MSKSRLQKEFERQAKIIERQVKALQDKGITFNPPEIESVAKKQTRIKKSDIETLRSISSDLDDLAKKHKISEDDVRKGRKISKGDEYISHPKKLLDEETKKERKNFQARKHRLEKQGYDVSQIGSARDYSLQQLRELKRGALSKLAFKNGESAYDVRNRQANEKRRQTLARLGLTEELKRLEATPMEYVRPRELGDYMEIGQGVLATHYRDQSIIEYLLNLFSNMSNAWGYPLEGEKQFLLSTFYDILNEYDDETGDNLLAYEDYLQTVEDQITKLVNESIYYDSKQEYIEPHLNEIIKLLQKRDLTDYQAKRLAEFQETAEIDYGNT